MTDDELKSNAATVALAIARAGNVDSERKALLAMLRYINQLEGALSSTRDELSYLRTWQESMCTPSEPVI